MRSAHSCGELWTCADVRLTGPCAVVSGRCKICALSSVRVGNYPHALKCGQPGGVQPWLVVTGDEH